MTFDPAWITPFAFFCREMLRAGVKCLFYTTIEGNPKRIQGDRWIYNDLSYIANSRYTARKLIEAGAKVTRIIRHGVNVDEIQSFKIMRDEIRRKLGVSENHFLVGYVGAGYLRKGHSLFAKVADEVMKRDQEVRIVVLTDEKGAKEYEDSKDVIVIDEFGELPKSFIYGFYHALDLYIHPSLSEGFGLPVLEALAAGKLVIHPDYEPLTEITDNETSIRIPVVSTEYRQELGAIEYEFHYYNPDDMIKAIMSAKNMVRERKDEISKKCISRARRFDFMKQYTKLINHLVERKISLQNL
jgi:glycosyltransferase involved in cell wall biosynthesis